MKYAFFNTKSKAVNAEKSIRDELGITDGTWGFPLGVTETYSIVEEIDGRWGFQVDDSGCGKADHLVDTEEYEPEEDDG
jgi:hypothetical protein